MNNLVELDGFEQAILDAYRSRAANDPATYLDIAAAVGMNPKAVMPSIRRLLDLGLLRVRRGRRLSQRRSIEATPEPGTECCPTCGRLIDA